jgi:hypothetical protein
MKTDNLCFKKHLGVNSSPSAVDSLRLELNPKCFCLLPYHHLEFAKFESAQNEDVITMLFLNRTVRITGKNLRALGLALQDRTVEFIKPLPERYCSLAGDDASVKTIEIEDKKENSHD